MVLTNEQTKEKISGLAQIESDISSILAEMSYELERSECFDCEQHAEIHTILRSIQADAKTHRNVALNLSASQAGEYVKDD